MCCAWQRCCPVACPVDSEDRLGFVCLVHPEFEALWAAGRPGQQGVQWAAVVRKSREDHSGPCFPWPCSERPHRLHTVCTAPASLSAPYRGCRASGTLRNKVGGLSSSATSCLAESLLRERESEVGDEAEAPSRAEIVCSGDRSSSGASCLCHTPGLSPHGCRAAGCAGC